MKFRLVIASALALGGLVMAAPASADILNITYAGHLTGTYTCTNAEPCGPTLALSNQFTGTYTIDTSLGPVTTDSATYAYVAGGTGSWAYVGVSPVTSTLLNIVAFPAFGTVSSLGSDIGEVYVDSSHTFQATYETANNAYFASNSGAIAQETYIHVVDPSIAFNLNTSFAITNPAGLGTFEYLDIDYACAAYACYNDDIYSGVLTSITVSDASVNAVPEPITLSLFGAGLAGAVAARRRRKANAVSGELS